MPTALAIFAHPDDIEFRAAGTMILLQRAGWEIHYCNLSSGNLGSSTMSSTTTARTRRVESQTAARLLKASWHPDIAKDLEIFYEDSTLRKVCSLIRKVKPDAILTHPPQDYMEDHMTTCRLVVSGAFARGIPNFPSRPPQPPTLKPTAVYHSTPHGLVDPLRQPVASEFWINTTSVHAQKRAALACHRSQKEWLDASQGMDSYLITMDDEGIRLAKQAKKGRYAEGWRRHLHYGFGSADFDPLGDALKKFVVRNPRYLTGI